MPVEIIYRVIKRDGNQAGEYMDKKLADAHDQRLDCIYTIVDLIEEKESGLSPDSVEAIAEHLVDNRQDLLTALKKVKDMPKTMEDTPSNVEPLTKAG